MSAVYDRERDEGYVPSTLPSRFLGWSEDAEALSVKRWPVYSGAAADFPLFLTNVIRERMADGFSMAVEKWGGTYAMTREPLTGFRRWRFLTPAALWRRFEWWRSGR